MRIDKVSLAYTGSSLVRFSSSCLQNPNVILKQDHNQQQEFQQIQKFGSLLQQATDISAGSLAHHIIVHTGYVGRRFLRNLLIELYGKYGALPDALNTFHGLEGKNVFTCNILIAVLVLHEHPIQALRCFYQMLAEGLTPDKYTYSTVIEASALFDSVSMGSFVHCMLLHGHWETHVVVATALINLYSKHKQLTLAKHAFDQVTVHDTTSWSAMIDAYARHGCEKMSVVLFERMQREWVKPDEISLTSVLGACSTFCDLARGQVFHYMIIEAGFETGQSITNALINMYQKCGNLEDGLFIFIRMHHHDVIAWSAIISAYAQVGLVHEALQLFYKMQAEGVWPNEVTFVNVLTACSHEGIVEEGLGYFLSIGNDHFMTPTSLHYGCLVDLYGRAGRLEEAELFLSNLDAIRHNAVIWQTLLGACRAHSDMERGKRVAERILALDHVICAPYLALSDFCTQ